MKEKERDEDFSNFKLNQSGWLTCFFVSPCSMESGWFYLLRCHSSLLSFINISYIAPKALISTQTKKKEREKLIIKEKKFNRWFALSLKWNLEREISPNLFDLRCLLSDGPLHWQRHQLSILRLSNLSHSSFSLVRYRDSVP